MRGNAAPSRSRRSWRRAATRSHAISGGRSSRRRASFPTAHRSHRTHAWRRCRRLSAAALLDRLWRLSRETRMKHATWTARLVFALVLAAAPAAHAQVLRIGLAEDPDVLDPTLARTFVGRIVFAALCDKLLDLDEQLAIVPQLATSYEWSPDYRALTLKLRQGVTFHDGERFDAAAVKFNIERHKSMQGSNRRGQLAPVTGVDVVDSQTVRLNLAAPFAPLPP